MSAHALRAFGTRPLTQLRLSSLALAKPPQPSPTRGEGLRKVRGTTAYSEIPFSFATSS
jgi:hypothetical protein